MRATDIMTRHPVTVRRGTSVRVAAELLARHRITSMPVLDDDDRLIGIVSEIDLLRSRMPHDPRASVRRRADGPDPARTVGDVMSDVVVCAAENADLADLASMLSANGVRAVPIVSGSALVGIVSRRDLVRTLVRDDLSILDDARARLADLDPDRTWSVVVVDGVVTVKGHAIDRRDQDAVAALLHSVPGVVRVHVKAGHFAH